MSSEQKTKLEALRKNTVLGISLEEVGQNLRGYILAGSPIKKRAEERARMEQEAPSQKLEKEKQPDDQTKVFVSLVDRFLGKVPQGYFQDVQERHAPVSLVGGGPNDNDDWN